MISVPQLQSQRGCSGQKDTARERDVTYRHCRATLLENEIGHSGKVWRHNRVKPRIVPHRTERCERVLLTNVTDGYDLRIEKSTGTSSRSEKLGCVRGVRTQQLQVACACACTKTQQRKQRVEMPSKIS